MGTADVVPGRECGECMVCCIAPTIDDPEIQKGSGTRCRHCAPAGAGGCAIYASRPKTCREFFCAWRRLASFPEDWRPDLTGVFATLDGAVIQENFEGGDPPLRGMSVSVFSREDERWHQAWVDNSGSYLDFVGDFDDGKMILQRDGRVEGKTVKQRMVWFDISENALEWNWERSDDEGKTWKVLWNIHYRRRSS